MLPFHLRERSSAGFEIGGEWLFVLGDETGLLYPNKPLAPSTCSLAFGYTSFLFLTTSALLFPHDKKGAQKPKNLFTIEWKNSFPVPFSESFLFLPLLGLCVFRSWHSRQSPRLCFLLFYYILKHFISGHESRTFDPPYTYLFLYAP